MKKIITLFLLLTIYFLMAGCTTQPAISGTSTDIASGYADETDEPKYWWYVRFKIVWPDDTEPDFAADLLMADVIVKPLLHEHRSNIHYWRFHRRAVRDNAGHQFSFIFYSGRNTAEKIYKSVLGNHTATQLKQDKILQDIILDNLDNNSRTEVKDTSDKNWPVEIQTAWPAYIMGVSSMWLQLIEQETGNHNDFTDTNTLLEKYRVADRKITALWQSEGQHAFLHHLNAIFGYEPMIIKKAIQF